MAKRAPDAYVQKYERPPITEAVIELRFASAFSDAIKSKISNKLKSKYGKTERELQVGVSVRDTQVGVESKLHGFKLLSDDALDVVLLRDNLFIVSRLAPYLGWADLRSKTNKVWRQVSK